MRIAHISDTHLGYKQYNLYEREDDFYDSLNQAIDKALEERVDVIIHSGDMFNTPTPPIKALFSFKNALNRINGKIKIFTVLGDHDKPKRRAMIPHRIFNIPVLGAAGTLESVEVDGVLIAGISNMKGIYIDKLKEEIQKFDILSKKYKKSVFVAHQGVKNFLPFERSYELVEDDLPRSADYYALGHIHARYLERFGEGWLAYSGSTEICSISEINPWREKGKGMYIVDITDGDTEVYPINLDIRDQYVIDTDERLEELKVLLEDLPIYDDGNIHGKKPLFHINILSNGVVNRKEIKKILDEVLKDKTLWYKPHFLPSKEVDKNIELQRSLDIKRIFDEYFKDEYLSNLAYDLYSDLCKDNIDNAKETAYKYLVKKYGFQI